MIARLTRLLPIFAGIIVGAFVLYFVLAWLTTPTRAKGVMIKLFLALTGVVSAFFLLAILYAFIDGNMVAAEFAFTFLAPALVGLGITLVCRYIFLKHNPSFGKTPVKAEVINPNPLRDFLEQLLNMFGGMRR